MENKTYNVEMPFTFSHIIDDDNIALFLFIIKILFRLFKY